VSAPSPRAKTPRPARRRRASSLSATVARTTAANVAVPVSALLTGPLLARYLGVADRGALAAVLAPLQLVTMLAALGMPEAVAYFVAGRRAPMGQALRVGLVVGLLSGLVAAAALIVLAPVLLRKAPEYVGLMRWMCVLVITSMAMAAVRSAAHGMRRFDLMNAERWLSVFTRLPLLLVFALAGALTVTSAAWITYGTGAASMLVLWLILRERGEEVAADPRLARNLLAFGVPAWIGSVASFLVLRIDQALIAPLVGVVQLGYYAVAVSLAEVPSTLHLAVRDVMFAAATNRADPHLIADGSRVLLLVTTGFACAGAALCPWVLPLLFGDGFEPAVRMAQILLFAGIPAGVSAAVGAGLLSAGQPRGRSIAQLAGLAVNVALLFVLVPSVGAIGAAWTAVVSYTLIAGLSVLLFARHTDVTVRECLLVRRRDVAAVRRLAVGILGRVRAVATRRGGDGS
jgi:O-antigen/teichoic acid export membrane protein